MEKHSDDYSDINDRRIPNPMKSDIQQFGVMANSDGRRVDEDEDSEARKNIRVY